MQNRRGVQAKPHVMVTHDFAEERGDDALREREDPEHPAVDGGVDALVCCLKRERCAGADSGPGGWGQGVGDWELGQGQGWIQGQGAGGGDQGGVGGNGQGIRVEGRGRGTWLSTYRDG